MSKSRTTLEFDSTPKGSSAPRFSPTSLAYLTALNYVLSHGLEVGPRGKMTLEVEDYHFRVDNPDSSPIVTNDPVRNQVISDYTGKEMKLYQSGSNLASDFCTASSFWKNIANPDGTINSAYGSLIWKDKCCGNHHLSTWAKHGYYPDESMMPPAVRHDPDCQLMTPWEWAKQSLIKDRHTRQAYLRFSRPDHQWFGNRDQVCTMHGMFLIRNCQLNLSVVMRSNDLVKGLAYDLPFFIFLMEQMTSELRQAYPGLSVGQYRHLSHSLHIYEHEIPKARAMLGLPVLESKAC